MITGWNPHSRKPPYDWSRYLWPQRYPNICIAQISSFHIDTNPTAWNLIAFLQQRQLSEKSHRKTALSFVSFWALVKQLVSKFSGSPRNQTPHYKLELVGLSGKWSTRPPSILWFGAKSHEQRRFRLKRGCTGKPDTPKLLFTREHYFKPWAFGGTLFPDTLIYE